MVSIMGNSLEAPRSRRRPRINDLSLIEITDGNALLNEESKADDAEKSTSGETINAALVRMQNKRIQRLICKNKIQGRARSSLNMMTVTDINFEEGDISEFILNSGKRTVGNLSEALNVGGFY